MKDFTTWAIASLFWLTAIYLFSSLIAWSFNPADWHWVLRLFAAMFGAFCVIKMMD